MSVNTFQNTGFPVFHSNLSMKAEIQSNVYLNKDINCFCLTSQHRATGWQKQEHYSVERVSQTQCGCVIAACVQNNDNARGEKRKPSSPAWHSTSSSQWHRARPCAWWGWGLAPQICSESHWGKWYGFWPTSPTAFPSKWLYHTETLPRSTAHHCPLLPMPSLPSPSRIMGKGHSIWDDPSLQQSVLLVPTWPENLLHIWKFSQELWRFGQHTWI